MELLFRCALPVGLLVSTIMVYLWISVYARAAVKLIAFRCIVIIIRVCPMPRLSRLIFRCQLAARLSNDLIRKICLVQNHECSSYPPQNESESSIRFVLHPFNHGVRLIYVRFPQAGFLRITARTGRLATKLFRTLS